MTSLPPGAYAKLFRFILDHPGFLAGINENGTPIIQVDAVARDGSAWTQYSTVWSFAGAREVLGY